MIADTFKTLENHIMAERRIIKQGNSLGVTIPPEMLERFDLRQGSSVEIAVDTEHQGILIRPTKPVPEDVTPEFVARVDRFLERYRAAMEELARR